MSEFFMSSRSKNLFGSCGSQWQILRSCANKKFRNNNKGKGVPDRGKPLVCPLSILGGPVSLNIELFFESLMKHPLPKTLYSEVAMIKRLPFNMKNLTHCDELTLY